MNVEDTIFSPLWKNKNKKPTGHYVVPGFELTNSVVWNSVHLFIENISLYSWFYREERVRFSLCFPQYQEMFFCYCWPLKTKFLWSWICYCPLPDPSRTIRLLLIVWFSVSSLFSFWDVLIPQMCILKEVDHIFYILYISLVLNGISLYLLSRLENR